MKHLISSVFGLLLLVFAFAPAASAADEPAVCPGCVWSTSDACGANALAAACATKLRVRITGTNGLCIQQNPPFGLCVEEFPCRNHVIVDYQSCCAVTYGLTLGPGGPVLEVFPLAASCGVWKVAKDYGHKNWPCGSNIGLQALVGDAAGGLAWCTFQLNCSACVN